MQSVVVSRRDNGSAAEPSSVALLSQRILLGLCILATTLPGRHVRAAPDFAPIRQFLEASVSDSTVAGGSLLVLHRGEVVFAEGFGFADLETKTRFQFDTPAIVASISKPLLGTVAFRLAEDGKVNLSSPIANYLPEFEKPMLEPGGVAARPPTTLELFAHTSGMRHAEAPGGRPWLASWTRGKPLADVVKRYAAEYPFETQPGTRYAYSGIGTDVAARLLEVAAERPRNALLVAELAKPLGMTQTFYRDAKSLESVGDLPTRYYRGADGTLLVARNRPVPPPDTYSSSGGSIISTAPDLACWLLMIRNGGRHGPAAFLAPDSVADMLSEAPRSRNAKGGLFVRKKDETGKIVVLGHTGSSGTNCWIDFEHDLIGIMLTQTRGKDIKPFRIELEERVTGCASLQDDETPRPGSKQAGERRSGG